MNALHSQSAIQKQSTIRHNWRMEEVLELFAMPMMDLIYQAQQCHRQFFDANEVQVSTLLSIKTGGCAEDCGYCPQSAKHNTGLKAEKLMQVDDVMAKARAAKEAGASRFCMGAAWRELKDRDLPAVTQMIEGVKSLGMESCMTLGMLTDAQAEALKNAGLDYYNHNLDSSESFYGNIITTRTYQDRLDTLERVRQAGMRVCCGGIVGMGETVEDRAAMLMTLANMPTHPESVPINMLVQVEGTPMHGAEKLDHFDMVRSIAVARIMMPASMVRLSAGREAMNDEMQALCFLAGANSIFYGEKLLTTANPEVDRDQALFRRLGIQAMQHHETSRTSTQPAAA